MTVLSTPPPGSEAIGSTVGGADNYASRYLPIWSRYVATSDSTISHINVKMSGAGNAKVAIYEDSGGSIGSLLSANNTGTAVVAGINAISITPTVVHNGTYYWLGVWATSQSFILANDASGRYAYQSTSSSFVFPSSISGYTFYGDYIRGLISGN